MGFNSGFKGLKQSSALSYIVKHSTEKYSEDSTNTVMHYINDVSVNDGPHIRRCSHNIIIYYNTYHCVTIAYSIQYSNMLYRFVA